MANIVTHLGQNLNWIAYRNGHNQYTITITLSGAAFDISTYVFTVNFRTIGGTTNKLQLTEGSGITNGGATGVLTIDLSEANITNLPRDTYFYEIVYTKSSKDYPFIQGNITLSSESNPASTSTSVSVSVNLAGSSVSAAVTLASVNEAISVASVTGTTTLTATALGKLHICTGTTSNYTITLPTAASNTGKTIAFKCSSLLTKLVTLDGLDAETIDGETTKVIWAKESITLISDGSNWQILEYKFRAMTSGLSIDSVAIAEDVAVKVLFDTEMYDNTGLMNDTDSHQINILRKGTYQLFGAAYPIATTAIPLFTVQTRIDGVQVTGIAGTRTGNTSGRNDQVNAVSRPVEIEKDSVVDLQLFISAAPGNFWARLWVKEIQA